jgi:hypothetical protein
MSESIKYNPNEDGGVSTTQCPFYEDKKVGSIGCEDCRHFESFSGWDNTVECKCEDEI